LNINIKSKESQSIFRCYRKILGKTYQCSFYLDYTEYMMKIRRLALVKSVSVNVGDYWYKNEDNKFPMGIIVKGIAVNKGVVRIIRVFCFRYSFDIGWLFKK